jgi:serine phosphatase RsbU (regulator of sigma subunit)
LLGFALGLVACSPQVSNPKAKVGLLDLSQWNFEKNTHLTLDGEWEFYWQFFLGEDLHQQPPTPYLIPVPSSWLRYTINQNRISGKGYATYRLMVKLPAKRPELALKLLTIGTAYELYANGHLLSSAGKVGKNHNEMRPYMLPVVVKLPEYATDDLELIIHVSNFHDNTGGIRQSIELGRSEVLQNHRDRMVAVDLIMAGGFFVMAIYHLGIYLLRRKDRSALYFFIVGLLFGLRTMLTDERYLLHLFPAFPWEFTFLIEYVTVYLGFPFYVMFFRAVYPEEFSKKALYIIQGICAILLLLVLVTPPSFFSETQFFAQIFMSASGVYIMYALVRAAYQDRDAARIFLVGSTIFFLTTINDILHDSHVIQTGFYASYGLLLFIFTQSFVLSVRLAKSFSTVEDLTQTLEKRVEERTQALALQTEEIMRKTDIIENKNKNITASINYASRIQQAILGSKEAVTSNFKDSFLFLQPRDIVSGDFYWYSEVKRSGSLPGQEHRTLFFKVIVAADCTGHGIPGAFMTVLGNTLLDEIINENRITNPGKILDLLDRKLRMKLQKHGVNDGMDIAMLLFDEENKKVSFAGAHHPLYYVRNNEIIQIDGSKFPIGSTQYAKKKFETHVIDYEDDDVFYIFSDGFQDQFGGTDNMKYYKKRFREFLLKISALPMAEQEQQLRNELEKWKGNHHQTDDVLVIGIRT